MSAVIGTFHFLRANADSPLKQVISTCAFTGAKPASEAPLVERPVQGRVRRHFHSEDRATPAAGVPEGQDDNLSSAHVVVDVVSDP